MKAVAMILLLIFGLALARYAVAALLIAAVVLALWAFIKQPDMFIGLAFLSLLCSLAEARPGLFLLALILLTVTSIVGRALREAFNGDNGSNEATELAKPDMVDTDKASD